MFSNTVAIHKPLQLTWHCIVDQSQNTVISHVNITILKRHKIYDRIIVLKLGHVDQDKFVDMTLSPLSD